MRTLFPGLLITTLALGACGAELDPHAGRAAALEAALAQGRRVVQGSLRASTSLPFGLAAAVADADEDEATGGPRWIRFDTRAVPSLARDALVDAARDVARDALGVDDLELLQGVRDLGPDLAVVGFARRQSGLLVRDAYVDVHFSRQADGDYRVRELTARHAGRIVPQNLDADAPSDAAILDLVGRDHVVTSSRELLFAKEHALDRHEYVVATELTLAAPSGESLTVTVEHGSGALLEAYSDRYAAGLNAKAHARSYRDAMVDWPLSFATGQSGGQARPLDALGQPDAPLEAPARLRLTGPRARIVGATQGAHELALADPTGATPVAAQGLDLRAVNAFVAIQRINTFTRRHLTPGEAPILAQPVAVSIDVQGNCNAFYTNVTISLFRDGNGCANMALVNDVIYHEWGHGLDDATGRTRGITDGAFSEGIGDILAAYMVSDPNMGVGFFTANDDAVRVLANTRRFPDDRGAVHLEGQIIGGTFWDLRRALIERYGPVKGAYDAERFFFRHLLDTDTYRDSYQAVLRLDDDDGNPATPSPNFCLITAAFAAHGLATLPADCQDDAERRAPKADQSIVVGILARDAAGLSLMAAAEDATELRLCVGDARQCAFPATGAWLELAVEGALQGKTAFVTKAPLALQEGAHLTLVKLDAAGAARGQRTVKLVTR